MIQKKSAAARITDLAIPQDLLSDSEHLNNETSPTSKETKLEVEFQLSETEFSPSQPIRMKKEEHYPQVIDQDVENFTTRLDTLVAQFRNESLKEFLTVKRTILHDQITTIDNEKKRCNALLSTKQDEIECLKERVENLSKENRKNESQKELLALTVGTLKARKLANYITSKVFSSWLHYHNSQQHKKRTKNLMKKLHRRAVINFVFLPWKQLWRAFHQAKVNRIFIAKLEEEKSQISMHFNKEIEMLRNRLTEAEKKISYEETEKINIQENLKKAFMRGVCAMNFEAMNILNPGQQTVENLGYEPQQKIEIIEKAESEKNTIIAEIGEVLPSESKELKWKAAPVFGRPMTAPEKGSGQEPNRFSGLPSIPVTNSASEGKVIVINNSKNSEVKITGKVPLKVAKKGNK